MEVMKITLILWSAMEKVPMLSLKFTFNANACIYVCKLSLKNSWWLAFVAISSFLTCACTNVALIRIIDLCSSDAYYWCIKLSELILTCAYIGAGWDSSGTDSSLLLDSDDTTSSSNGLCDSTVWFEWLPWWFWCSPCGTADTKN